MERNLLEIVQGILSTLDSDTVNTIAETVESDQVVDIIKKVFYDIVDEYQLPATRKLTNLVGLSDTTKPNLLKLPDNTQSLLTWKYDMRLTPEDTLTYRDVTYKMPGTFLDIVNGRDAGDTTNYMTVVVNPTVSVIVYKKDAPRYWTSFDDTYIVTDNFNEAVDATLQASKTQAWIEMRPTFLKEDTFVPPLPSNLHGLLYRTAENECYSLFKQAVNPHLHRAEARMRIRAQRNKHRSQQVESNLWSGAPDYGRRTR